MVSTARAAIAAMVAQVLAAGCATLPTRLAPVALDRSCRTVAQFGAVPELAAEP
jgi:hypothetical protein